MNQDSKLRIPEVKCEIKLAPRSGIVSSCPSGAVKLPLVRALPLILPATPVASSTGCAFWGGERLIVEGSSRTVDNRLSLAIRELTHACDLLTQ